VNPDFMALLDTQRAFDGVASTYDASHATNAIIHGMRDRLRRAVVARVPAGGRVLDLGCGPGRDAVWFARRGYRVVAIDWSPEMVRQARHRVAREGLAASVDVHYSGIGEVTRFGGDPFDGAYSDLGPLNCVPDLRAAASAIAGCLRDGGVLVSMVMARVCPWEILLHIRRREWERIRVRFSTDAVPVPVGGTVVWTRYYNPGVFARECRAAGLMPESCRSVGLLVPPPYCTGFAERHPAVVDWLARVDDVVGSWPVLRAMGDHLLMVLRQVRA
jgi:SAM-dependent methyltransferase